MEDEEQLICDVTDAFEVEVSSTRMTEQGLWITGYAALEGVLNYPKRGVSEYVSGEVLKDSDDRMRGIPVTIEHPRERVTTKNRAKYSRGVVMFAETDLESTPPRQKVELLLDSPSSIRQVQKRERIQLSTGYDRKFVEETGDHNGNPYQVRQTQRLPNHLAITKKARSGDGATLILDAYDGEGMEPEELQKIVTAAVTGAVAPLQTKIAELEAAVNTKKTTEPDPADPTDNNDGLTEADVRKRAAKRAKILAGAAVLGVELENEDSASNEELMQQVVKSQGLDNVDSEELPGVFRLTVESAGTEEKKPSKKTEPRSWPRGSKKPTNNDADELSERQRRIQEAERDAYKARR